MRVTGTPHPGIEKWTKVIPTQGHSIVFLHSCTADLAAAAAFTPQVNSAVIHISMIGSRRGICVQDPIEHNIYLPSPIDPYSAKALVTLHGLLYISIVMAASTS